MSKEGYTDEIYFEIEIFLKKRKKDSYTIYQICEMLEIKFGTVNPEYLLKKYFKGKNKKEYLNLTSLNRYKESRKKDNILSSIEIVWPTFLLIFIYFIIYIFYSDSSTFLFISIFSLLSFILLNHIDYINNKDILISRNIPFYTIILSIVYYSCSNPFIQKNVFFSLDEHILINNDLYVVTVSFFVFIILRLIFYNIFNYLTVIYFLINLFFLLLDAEFYYTIQILMILTAILLGKYKKILDKKTIEIFNNFFKKPKKQQQIFIFIIATLLLSFNLTLSNKTMDDMKEHYYNLIKEKNKFYCINIPYNYTIIKNSAKPNHVVLDANDITILELEYFIIHNNKNLYFNEFYFPFNKKYIYNKMKRDNKNHTFFYHFHLKNFFKYEDLIKFYIESPELFKKDYLNNLNNLEDNKNFEREFELKFNIIDSFLKTKGDSNFFYYKCE